MSKYGNRYNWTDEIVHHKNHDKLDNRIENLELTNRVHHIGLHYADIYGKIQSDTLWEQRLTDV